MSFLKIFPGAILIKDIRLKYLLTTRILICGVPLLLHEQQNPYALKH
jgi:hypothetical protein